MSHRTTAPQLSSTTSNLWHFRLGCAVWAYKGWLGNFLPASTRSADMLRCYAQRMQTVEGNSFFYAVPSTRTLERWVEQTPDTFRVCPKIPREISHRPQLAPQLDAARRFLDHLFEGLGPRLGPVFLQLPPSHAPSQGPDLARLLNGLRRHTDHPLLVEVRHADWYVRHNSDRLDTLLYRLDLGRVILDTRAIYSGSDDPQADNPRKKPKLPHYAGAPGQMVIVRFIAHPHDDRNLQFLTEWAGVVHRWLGTGKEVYFFVHCPDETHSPRHARTFQALLEARGAPVPPLPWNDLPDEPQQVGLF